MDDIQYSNIQKGEQIRMSEEKKEDGIVQKETKRKAARQETGRTETVMYIGPTIKNVAVTGTLYNNGLPESLKKEAEKQPAISNLIVPVGELAAAQRELAIPGSALAVIYGKVITE